MTLTLYVATREGRNDPIWCQNCGTKVQAGGQWILFCPICNVTEKNMYVSHVMSCTHCDTPLTIFMNKDDGGVYGRCHNPDCGDCYSMQDLTLIPLNRTIGALKRTSRLIEILEQLPEKEEPVSKERLPKQSTLFQFSVIPVAPTCGYIPGTDRGHKTPRRPSLDQLDS